MGKTRVKKKRENIMLHKGGRRIWRRVMVYMGKEMSLQGGKDRGSGSSTINKFGEEKRIYNFCGKIMLRLLVIFHFIQIINLSFIDCFSTEFSFH